MTIVRATVDRTGWTGLRGINAQESFTVPYLIESDDNDDGPNVIFNHFAAQPTLPSLGDTYSFGNDVNPLFYTQQYTNPVRDRNSVEPRIKWTMSVNFVANYRSESGEDENGDTQVDPLLWRREFDISLASRTVDAWQAHFLGVYQYNDEGTLNNIPHDGGAGNWKFKSMLQQATPPHTFTEDTPAGDPVNSVGDPLDPPLEDQEADAVLRITMNQAAYQPAWWGYFNKINDRDIKLDDAFFNITNWQFAAGTLRCESIDGSFQFVNNVRYYRCVFEFHYRESGWWQDVLDMGRQERDENAPAGKPKAKTIEDVNTRILQDPVPLNGSGLVSDGTTANSYYLRYLVGKTRIKDFSLLPIGFTTDV